MRKYTYIRIYLQLALLLLVFSFMLIDAYNETDVKNIDVLAVLMLLINIRFDYLELSNYEKKV